MKMVKLTSVAVMATLLISAVAPSANAVESTDLAKKAAQMKSLEKISNDSKGKEEVSWNEEKSVPKFVVGEISDKKLKQAKDSLQVMEENKALFDMKSAYSELKLISESKDDLGFTSFKYQQVYQGIPVYGNELILHADKDGNTTSVNGYYDPEVKEKKIRTKAKYSADKAIAKAKKETKLSDVKSFDIENSKLVIYEDNKKKHRLVYQVTLSTVESNEPAYFDVFVDAQNLKVVHSVNKATHATGTGKGVLGDNKSFNTLSSSGTYYLQDSTRNLKTYTARNSANENLLPGTLLSDSDNYWTDGAAVDAHTYAAEVYDYYKTKFNRNSFDGNGAAIKSTVHFGRNFNNAYWNGAQMIYGDGDGSTFVPLSGALDVVGHEITHAVIERSANLVYENQSGALNESFADVLGNLIEDRDNGWLLGEDIYTPSVSGDALRSMSNPESQGDPAHMDDYKNLPNTREGDWGGVHTNSGIPNKAFVNFVETSGITRDNAGKVWYRALTSYMTSRSDFDDARNATIQAATDLFGSSSTEVTAVTNAWAAVGVGSPADGGSGPTTDAYESNDSMSTAYGPITSGKDYSAYIGSSSDVDWFKFSTGSTGSINLSLSNLPADYDLYLYNASGTVLSNSENGNTSSESISYSSASAGTYYVKIAGYNGAKSTSQAYKLNATFAGSSSGSEQESKWNYETKSFETPHPYSNNYNNGNSHTYTKAGAQKVALHFSSLETESGYDFVYIKDKNGSVKETYSGSKSAFWVIVDGDTITSNLVTDSSVNANGYVIDQVAYFK
ncbi:M4 family metallopeptidase [Hazenella sp. IB182357]|uniref:M4 family metallopeptidase n=1 Tax=Polycladospora coralii TaxID=2771432 RepID=A0A926RXS7_9BACL|nr:M4 family metallopeptidase [Polycladospora coralii]MBD1372811.1 M4 family metallopeptidase [Polycladospora coralii]